jgi:hypothetical protein
MEVKTTARVSQNYHFACGKLVSWESELPFLTHPGFKTTFLRKSELPKA